MAQSLARNLSWHKAILDRLTLGVASSRREALQRGLHKTAWKERLGTTAACQVQLQFGRLPVHAVGSVRCQVHGPGASARRAARPASTPGAPGRGASAAAHAHRTHTIDSENAWSVCGFWVALSVCGFWVRLFCSMLVRDAVRKHSFTDQTRLGSKFGGLIHFVRSLAGAWPHAPYLGGCSHRQRTCFLTLHPTPSRV